MRLITATDIIGQMARFAVSQHPFLAPNGLFEVCQLLGDKAREQFKDTVVDLPMQWFKDSWEISTWLRSVLDGHPTLTAWNTPMSGPTANGWVFVSRYDWPTPEDDFIDIDALFINVSREAWNAADDFAKSADPNEAVLTANA